MLAHEFISKSALEGTTPSGSRVFFALGHLTIIQGAPPQDAAYIKIVDPGGNVTLETALKSETFGLLITLIHHVFAEVHEEQNKE